VPSYTITFLSKNVTQAAKRAVAGGPGARRLAGGLWALWGAVSGSLYTTAGLSCDPLFGDRLPFGWRDLGEDGCRQLRTARTIRSRSRRAMRVIWTGFGRLCGRLTERWTALISSSAA